MREVKVDRGAVLDRIRKNRDGHRALFLKAQEGFRARVIEELDRMQAEARKPDGRIQLNVRLQAPEDHTADYDRVIDMLEMSVVDEIVLDAQSFAQFVRDEWAWSRLAAWKNSTYASGGSLPDAASM